jgi:DNA-binding transcriptional LysR family regulator
VTRYWGLVTGSWLLVGDVNWDDLQVFLAIARAGRISAAARRLDVEHTTVSRRLAALEAELGVPLFYRTAAGYVPTPHGHNVLSSAEAMESAAIAVAARAREKSAAIAGRVRLALPPEFASHWLAPKLADFRTVYPQIELQVLVGTRQRNLWRGEAELAVQSPRPPQRGLVTIRIARTALALYAAKALVGSGRIRISGSESLHNLSLLTYTSSFDMLQDAKWFQTLRASSAVSLTTNSTHALLSAARAGAGVAVLPKFVARAHHDLVVVSDNVAEQDVWLITHPEFRRDPKVRATADFLKKIANGPLGLC